MPTRFDWLSLDADEDLAARSLENSVYVPLESLRTSERRSSCMRSCGFWQQDPRKDSKDVAITLATWRCVALDRISLYAEPRFLEFPFQTLER
jgi:hypothetical protein